ncbi:MAG: cobyrinic acid a,c-diamide synthase [Bacteroidetes bacterium GWA2_32_17]|nr:MAG: cobyrinic acid a,c-diamide synthase [Bacteroidetes bacterium GWA2_32_17]
MKIISVINYKGGVGKTTLTANIAGELAFRDYNVLMIDLDPQASLTFSFLKPDDWREKYAKSKTIREWFNLKSKNFNDLIIVPEEVQKWLIDKGILNLVSSHLGLINVDLELATMLGGANMQQNKQNFVKVHRLLLNGINQLDKDKYDIILIDCPPNFNIVTKNAIVASDFILIPAKPDYLSTMGIDYLQESVKELVKDYNEYCKVKDEDIVEKIKPKLAGVVFTMVQYYAEEPISATRPFIAQTEILGQENNFKIFENKLRENKTLFADAPQHGVPIVLSNNYRGIADEIKEFVTEFITKIKL